MNKGKLIVIEGTDGSGKATQTFKLYDKLSKLNKNVTKVEFPNYKSDSSALIKMYLNGEFGEDVEDVNAYTASTFYAVDRFASYKKEWKKMYEQGQTIIADRYTTSNMIHQGAKFNDNDEKTNFLNWLFDLEYNKFSLPQPDCTIFLDMPPEYSEKLMKDRANKFTGEQNKDIHERNIQFITDSYNNAKYIAQKYNWVKISCVENGKIKSIDMIHEEILKIVQDYI